MILYLFNFVIGIPFSYYSTFVIEEKFGFNKTNLKTFISDKIKGLFISSALIVGLTSLAFLLLSPLALATGYGSGWDYLY